MEGTGFLAALEHSPEGVRANALQGFLPVGAAVNVVSETASFRSALGVVGEELECSAVTRLRQFRLPM